MLASDVEQTPVAHARGTGGFAGSASQATVDVQLGLGGDRRAFQHLLHQVDTAARAVELVAEQLVGGAGGVAEAAVHAFSQDRVGFAAVRGFEQGGGEPGLHVRSPGRGGRD